MGRLTQLIISTIYYNPDNPFRGSWRDWKFVDKKCFAPYCRKKSIYKLRYRGDLYPNTFALCEYHTWLVHMQSDFDMGIPLGRKNYEFV